MKTVAKNIKVIKVAI